jgi:prepilin-type N-terminal cleavage/methylation domain-containing protein/prepilin-type processing-associated H-X9-DG protein
MKGFTLIELLVVVAIIAVLISILIPAIQGAGEMARTAACMSNFRSTHLAMMMYINDFNDTFPPCYDNSDLETRCWEQKLLKYTSGQYKVMLCSKFDHSMISPDKTSMYNYYYNFMSVYVDSNGVIIRNPRIGYNHRFLGCDASSLTMDSYGCEKKVTCKLSGINSPSSMIELAESINMFATYTKDIAYRDLFSIRFAVYPHYKGSANFGFVDGHVKTVPSDSPLYLDVQSWTDGK